MHNDLRSACTFTAAYAQDPVPRKNCEGSPFLYAVTQAPAKAVHLDHQIGRIAVGLQADLLILDEKLALHSVYIDGKEIKR